MSRTKLDQRSFAIGAVLCASLVLNAYLLFREPPTVSITDTAAAVAPASPASPASTDPVSLVKQANLATLRDQLRAAGASDGSAAFFNQ